MKTISIIGIFTILLIDNMVADSQLEAIQAVQSADVEKLQKMIDSGFDFYSIPSDRYNEVIFSLPDEKQEKVSKFVYLNVEKIIANCPRMSPYTKIRLLLNARKPESLREALKTSPIKPSELLDPGGRNFLLWAVIGNAENDILMILIESGISPNQADKSGETALNLAASIEDEPTRSRILKCLIEHGGDMSLKLEGGLSAEEILKDRIAREEKAKPAK